MLLELIANLLMKDDLIREVELENSVKVRLEGNNLKITGPKGDSEKIFVHPRVHVTVDGNKIVLKAPKATKREKTILCSFEAHIKNMVKGVQEVHTYTLKICSGHFPMNVAVAGSDFVVKNFLGEAVPRKARILKGVDVKITGNDVVVSSCDKEVAGQMAGRIENLCRITNRDRRIFQDGIYITHKAGK